MKVRVAVSREARYRYRGQRVGEASHPGPMRCLRRSKDVRNVFPRLATQSREADNDDDRPLVLRSRVACSVQTRSHEHQESLKTGGGEFAERVQTLVL